MTSRPVARGSSDAIDTFQTIIDNYPYSAFAVKAELRIADAYFDDGRWDEALSYYRDFGDLHPQHERVPYTLLRSALCHYNQVQSVERDQTATREALLSLEQLIRSHPFAKEAADGEDLLRELRRRLAVNELRIGDFYLKRDEFQSAAERYRGLLNGDDIPRTTEIILSFDDDFDDFSRKLQQLSKEWEASGLREGQR